MAVVVQGFAESVDPLSRARRELVRDVQHVLELFERHRRDEDRGRLLQLLDDLALLVRTRG